MKTTAYFNIMRLRPDRAVITDEWVQRASTVPIREVKLAHGEAVHNAFFDRGFNP